MYRIFVTCRFRAKVSWKKRSMRLGGYTRRSLIRQPCIGMRSLMNKKGSFKKISQSLSGKPKLEELLQEWKKLRVSSHVGF